MSSPRGVARPVRAAAALVAGVLLLSACGGGVAGGSASSGDGEGRTASRALPNAAAGPREDTPSALDDMRQRSFPAALVDPDQILSGGPPPDGIPAIDSPRFVRADDVEWLGDGEPVLSLTVDGETRGYPLEVMTYHEIVNDTVGEVPVAVTYCPLCNSGVAFQRRAAGRVLSFGTSGRLFNDNLVMYDRQTESLWPQLTGTASIGVLTGTRLTPIPMGIVDWDRFRQDHPDAWVLSRDTGFDRAYGRNPYVGYDRAGTDPLFPLATPTDPRLDAKTRVVGVEVGTDSVAVVRAALASARVLTISVGGDDVVLFHVPGQRSALGDQRIADGAEIGSVATFDASFEGRRLEFEAVDGGFRDTRTGSRWDFSGRAVSGPSAGARLEPVRHLDTFWFSWVAFHPGTGLEPAGGGRAP